MTAMMSRHCLRRTAWRCVISISQRHRGSRPAQNSQSNRRLDRRSITSSRAWLYCCRLSRTRSAEPTQQIQSANEVEIAFLLCRSSRCERLTTDLKAMRSISFWKANLPHNEHRRYSGLACGVGLGLTTGLFESTDTVDVAPTPFGQRGPGRSPCSSAFVL
jgi:hypothetical protein